MDCEEIIGFCVFEEFLFCFVSFSLSFFFFGLSCILSSIVLLKWASQHFMYVAHWYVFFFILILMLTVFMRVDFVRWPNIHKEVCEEIIGFLKRFYCYFVSFSSWKWVLWAGLICIVKKYLCFDEFFVLFHFL